MNDELKYQLLRIISHNGNILELTNQGYEFGQVTYFIDTLKNEDNYIEYDANNKMVVTPTGKWFLRDFEANQNIRTYSQWILPRTEMWCKPINKFTVYIPKR